MNRSALFSPLFNGLKAVGGLLLPRQCLLCGRQPLWGGEGPLCASCKMRLPRPHDSGCARCGSPLPPGLARKNRCPGCTSRPSFVHEVRAPYRYEGALRDLIQTFKFKPEPGLGRMIGSLLVRGLEAHPFLTPLDQVTPVPLFPRRKRKRGFNQSELLARHVAGEMGLVLNTRSIFRWRDTDSQIGKGVRERRRNVRGAFRFRRGSGPAGKRVLLIDDVLTTGSTASEAAHALKRGGAKVVVFASVARAGLESPV